MVNGLNIWRLNLLVHCRFSKSSEAGLTANSLKQDPSTLTVHVFESCLVQVHFFLSLHVGNIKLLYTSTQAVSNLVTGF